MTDPIFAVGDIHGRKDAVIHFARTGDPNHDGLPDWPRYDLQRRAILRLSTDPAILDDPYAGHRPAWVGIPFDGSVLHAIPEDVE